MNTYKHIVKEDGICGGRPTIKGTRLEVDWIMKTLIRGDVKEVNGWENAEKELKSEWHLTQEQIDEAVKYHNEQPQKDVEPEVDESELANRIKEFDNSNESAIPIKDMGIDLSNVKYFDIDGWG